MLAGRSLYVTTNKSNAMKLTKLLAIAACATFPLLAGAQTKYTRGILVEYYTSQYCGNCPPASDALKTLYAAEGGNGRVVWLTHHYGYANDTLTIEASKAPYELLGLSGAPNVLLNRTYMRLGSGAENLVLNAPQMVNYSNYLERTTGNTLFQREMATGADISLDMDLTYDEDTRDLTVKVYGEKNELFDASNPTLTIYIAETAWVSWQMEYYPGIMDYHHMNPVRVLVSDNDLGDALEFGDDKKTYSMTYRLTVPESVGNYPTYDVDVPLNRDSLYVAAFISNINMSNRENIKVYNAVKCDLGNNSTVGITAVPSADNLAIVVEDGTIKVNGSDTGFDIYNLAGQVVPNRSLRRGIYLVRTMQGEKPVVRKVLVN